MADRISLGHIANFVDLLNRFRQVRRAVLVNGEDRWENDVEHSYHLAMLAWYIVTAEGLPLDINKVITYALIHDFVEVHAGDVPFNAGEELRAGKAEREHEASKTLRRDLPEFAGLHESIEKYEKREDPESRFVYALDKLQPMLQIYVDGGRTWKRNNVTLIETVAYKESRVAVSPEVAAWYSELIKELRLRESELFPVSNG